MKLTAYTKRELTFWGIGILMLGIVILTAISALQFLVSQLNMGLNSDVVQNAVPIRFEFYKVQDLLK